MKAYKILFNQSILLLLLVVGAPVARADFTCHADFNYSIVVKENQIRVIGDSITLLQINNDSQLFVEGTWIKLDEAQTRLLTEYATGLHKIIPQMTVLGAEGVDLAIETIESVFIGLVGEDSESFDKLKTSMDRVRYRVHEKFKYTNEYYYIGEGSLEDVDDYVDSQLEKELEKAISTSIGGILSAVGGLNGNNSEVTSDKLHALFARLQNMEGDLQQDMPSKVSGLKSKAKWFCQKLIELNKIEEQLRKSIPQLADYDIIVGH